MTAKLKTGKRFEIDESFSIARPRYVAIDIELSGLDQSRDTILSVGAIRMTGGRIELKETFYRRIVSLEALSVQGLPAYGVLPADMVIEGDPAPAISEFINFCANYVLVGHLISTDLDFLKKEVKKYFGKEVRNPVIDTYLVYHWLKRREASGEAYSPVEVKLHEVANRLGISAVAGTDAMSDAFITAQVFQRLIPMLLKAGVKTMGELRRIGDPSEGLR